MIYKPDYAICTILYYNVSQIYGQQNVVNFLLIFCPLQQANKRSNQI
jgi:hypothetical protein